MDAVGKLPHGGHRTLFNAVAGGNGFTDERFVNTQVARGADVVRQARLAMCRDRGANGDQFRRPGVETSGVRFHGVDFCGVGHVRDLTPVFWVIWLIPLCYILDSVCALAWAFFVFDSMTATSTTTMFNLAKQN